MISPKDLQMPFKGTSAYIETVQKNPYAWTK